MEASIVYWGYIGMMDKKMETTKASGYKLKLVSEVDEHLAVSLRHVVGGMTLILAWCIYMMPFSG